MGNLETIWEPAFITSKLLHRKIAHDDFPSGSSSQYAAVVVNQPIEDQQLLLDILAGATLTVFADGAANYVKDLKLTEPEEQNTIPDFICGDLDSIRPEVRAHYEEKGTKVIQDLDQYSSDLTKSLRCIEKNIQSPMHAVIIGGIGGRFDQGFSQLHHLYTVSHESMLPHGQIFLVNPQSICFLLQKGPNRISTPVGPGLFAENIGIIPIGRPSVINTKGLEWDVTDWHTEIGGQVSTSNHIKRETIEVETSERVLFTIEMDRSQEQ
ncbi:MAG: hypothetical protein LQ339_003528 [Xanthoria mediterranea]|nr:MAG: hypothetical protein LQ339_003528 [Xanthoria mediterranea]